MYLNLDEIKTIQLDHTSRCNLGCSQCARTYHNDILPIVDLTVDDYKKILEPFDASKIELLHCGNFGDVIASPTFDETLDYCLERGVEIFKISTNGSARNTQWWKELATKIGKKSVVTFAIDGFENTNHIYRKNSNWKKIKENLEAFIEAGGRAKWNYILFEHNIQDLEISQEYAKTIGVERFSIKNSSRFLTVNDYDKKVFKILPEPNNKNIKDHEQIVEHYGTFDNYVSTTNISCKYKTQKIIFVDFETRVWPCTWTAAPIFFNKGHLQRNSIDILLEKYGNDFNKLNKYSWQEILNHEFFKTKLEESWGNTTNNTENPRLYTCGKTCGEKFEFSSGYGQNITTIKLNE